MKSGGIKLAVGLLIVCALLLLAAWIALPRQGERGEAAWKSIPSVAVVIKAEGDTVVRVWNAMWPTPHGDAMYVAEVYIEEIEQRAPPGFGWLWGEWITHLRCRGGQWFVLADWSPESLPSGAQRDIEEIIREQINDGRYADRERESPGTIGRILEQAVPVQVEISNPRVTWPMPAFDADVPPWRLWLVSALSAAALLFGFVSLVAFIFGLLRMRPRTT